MRYNFIYILQQTAGKRSLFKYFACHKVCDLHHTTPLYFSYASDELCKNSYATALFTFST